MAGRHLNIITKEQGLTLVELLLALSLTIVVLCVGFSFYLFALNTYNISEQSSHVRQKISYSTDYIANEVVFSTHVELIDTIPIEVSFKEDYNYIYVENGVLKQRYGNNSPNSLFESLFPGVYLEEVLFSLNDSLLSFTLKNSGTDDYNIESTVKLLNLQTAQGVNGKVLAFKTDTRFARIDSFSFKKSNNPSLLFDVHGNINHNSKTVEITVPQATNLTSLIPQIITFPLDANISPNASSPTDFSIPVNYSVNSLDYSNVIYTVYVKTAPIGEIHPPDAPKDANNNYTVAYTYIDGVEVIYQKAELASGVDVNTNGFLFIPSSYEDINIVANTAVNYNAKEGIFIGANIYTKASHGSINLRACDGPIEIDGATFEITNANASIVMQSRRYISAKNSTIESQKHISLTANEYIDISGAKLIAPHNHSTIRLSAESVSQIIRDFHTIINLSITSFIANGGDGVTCP